jgi:hypothetical protein
MEEWGVRDPNGNDDDLSTLWTLAILLRNKMMQVLDNDNPTEDVAMLATASLVAQIIINLHEGDNEEAVAGFREIWQPNIEGLIRGLGEGSMRLHRQN